jgi:hypothetical protein
VIVVDLMGFGLVGRFLFSQNSDFFFFWADEEILYYLWRFF